MEPHHHPCPHMVATEVSNNSSGALRVQSTVIMNQRRSIFTMPSAQFSEEISSAEVYIFRQSTAQDTLLPDHETFGRPIELIRPHTSWGKTREPNLNMGGA
jgi:hypothetical protein